ncbi:MULTISPECIES: hypothetical protein [unclassified Nocardioides]|uniref:hypothetical protein n=1 Tax=unclassified Nocardioides TaxID=2615069 RepID=UPI00361F3571
MDPTQAEWWWTVLFGALASGAVTGLALWWTLRHERRSTEMTELRKSVADLQASAFRAGSQGPASDDWYDWLGPVYAAASDTSARAYRISPFLASEVARESGKLVKVLDSEPYEGMGEDAKKALVQLISMADWWLKDAKAFERTPGR